MAFFQARKNATDWEEQHAARKVEAESAVNRLKMEHENMLKKVKMEGEDTIRKVQMDHENAIRKKELESESTLKSLKMDYENALKARTMEFESALKKMQMEQESLKKASAQAASASRTPTDRVEPPCTIQPQPEEDSLLDEVIEEFCISFEDGYRVLDSWGCRLQR